MSKRLDFFRAFHISVWVIIRPEHFFGFMIFLLDGFQIELFNVMLNIKHVADALHVIKIKGMRRIPNLHSDSSVQVKQISNENTIIKFKEVDEKKACFRSLTNLLLTMLQP